jgi:hypothetical protein
MDLVAMNPGSVVIAFEPTKTFSGQLATSVGSWSVELRAMGPSARAFAPGAFTVHRYAVVMPSEATGHATRTLERENEVRRLVGHRGI